MAEKKCKHEIADYYLAPADEKGWKCDDCQKLMPGDPPGYRPDLDREQTGSKVGAILLMMHTNDLIYLSNNSEGDFLEGEIAKRCKETGLYDQYSIILFIMQAQQPDHAEYWKRIGDGVVSGNDVRDRCWCGKLSTQSGQNGSVCSMKHDVDFRGRVKTVRRRKRAGQDPLFVDQEEDEHFFGKLLASKP